MGGRGHHSLTVTTTCMLENLWIFSLDSVSSAALILETGYAVLHISSLTLSACNYSSFYELCPREQDVRDKGVLSWVGGGGGGGGGTERSINSSTLVLGQ